MSQVVQPKATRHDRIGPRRIVRFDSNAHACRRVQHIVLPTMVMLCHESVAIRSTVSNIGPQLRHPSNDFGLGLASGTRCEAAPTSCTSTNSANAVSPVPSNNSTCSPAMRPRSRWWDTPHQTNEITHQNMRCCKSSTSQTPCASNLLLRFDGIGPSSMTIRPIGQYASHRQSTQHRVRSTDNATSTSANKLATTN